MVGDIAGIWRWVIAFRRVVWCRPFPEFIIIIIINRSESLILDYYWEFGGLKNVHRDCEWDSCRRKDSPTRVMDFMKYRATFGWWLNSENRATWLDPPGPLTKYSPRNIHLAPQQRICSSGDTQNSLYFIYILEV